MNAADLETLRSERKHKAPTPLCYAAHCWCGLCHCDRCQQVRQITGSAAPGDAPPKKKGVPYPIAGGQPLSEHFTRSTETVRQWCPQCGRYTEFTVSHGHVGHCTNDHRKHKDKPNRTLPRAAIPTWHESKSVPWHGVQLDEATYQHIAALDGARNRGEE